jgi:hypothetical protein
MTSQNPWRVDSDAEGDDEPLQPSDWDNFPDRLIPQRVVRKLRGDPSNMTIHRHVRRGILPPPLVIAGRNFWRLGDIIRANRGKGSSK